MDLKEQRRTRGKAIEKQVQGIFREAGNLPAETAQAGLLVLGEKIQEDLQEQLQEVGKSFARQEVARLLRMLEKRKEMLDKLQQALAVDEGLMKAAAQFAPYWSQAEN